MNWNRFAARRVYGYYAKTKPKRKMKQDDILPTVESGIPIPNIRLRDGRHLKRRPSKWRGFLNKLEVGQSFVAEWPECSSVRAMARALSIPLVWQPLAERGPNNRPQERYWRVTESWLALHR